MSIDFSSIRDCKLGSSHGVADANLGYPKSVFIVQLVVREANR